jgi:hypothetical protein
MNIINGDDSDFEYSAMRKRQHLSRKYIVYLFHDLEILPTLDY